jgi:hypothetical protein
MFTFSTETSLFWLPMVGLGAAILLLVGGFFTLFPQIGKMSLVLLVAAILAIFWAVFLREFSAPYSIFIAAVILITWAALTWASASRRPAIVAFIASVILALFWLPVPVSVLHSQAVIASVLANAAMVALWLLIIAALVLSGLTLFRAEPEEL